MNEVEQSVKAVAWLGETWGFWIQTGAFVLSAAAAIAVIYFNSRQARRRATIDLILHQKGDAVLLENTRIVWELAEKNGTFAQLAKETSSAECKAVLKVLNNHEFVALGIRMNAFDQKIYKMSQYSNVMKVWNASDGFIRELRCLEGKHTLFQELEWLANQWDNKPIVKIKHQKFWHIK